MGKILEVRWHGRGGMGAVTAAELIAKAAIREGKYAQSFPNFGSERRGAPVMAFLRISDEVIRVRTNVYEPDVVMVLDSRLMRVVDVTAGLESGGTIVVNSMKSPDKVKAEEGYKWAVATIDAKKVAMEELGVPITNTAMIGAFLKVTEVVKMDSLMEELRERFGKRADRNIKAMERAYKETVIKE